MAAIVAGFHPERFSENILNTCISNEKEVPQLFKWALERIKNKSSFNFPEPFIEKTNNIKIMPFFRYKNKYENKKPFNNSIFKEKTDLPEAVSFTYPVLKYEEELVFSTPRNSFGAGEENIHLGDDCAWFRDGTPVFAITEGIVRLSLSSEEWGNIVVIEHRCKTNYFCSIYGHLSDAVLVKAKDIVSSGQLIGLTGFSYSYENGGYGSHLHFAIAEGTFLKPKYIPGKYIKIKIKDSIETALIYKVEEDKVFLKTSSGIKVIEKSSETLNDQIQWIKGYELKENGTKGWFNPMSFLKMK